MKTNITFCGIYEGMITANEIRNGCEIIGAECITNKFSFKERADMRHDVENPMVDIRIEMEDAKDDRYIHENRHQFIYHFINSLAERGVVFDQFIITCNTLRGGMHSYHILASVLDQEGFNVDIHNIEYTCRSAAEEFAEDYELSDRTVALTFDEPDMTMMILSPASYGNRYGGNNPFCHEQVLPYRELILRNLERELFGSHSINH